MAIKIKKLSINQLFEQYDVEWSFNDSVSVLVGDNGVGKSTILQILYSLLLPNTLENNPQIIPLFHSAQLELDNGDKIVFSTKDRKADTQVLVALGELLEKMENLRAIQKQEHQKEDEVKTKIDSIKTKIDNMLKMINDLDDEGLPIVGKDAVIYSCDKEGKKRDVKQLSDLFHIELVSTLFMSANSVNEIKGSDGKVFTVLDLEIKDLLSELSRIENSAVLKSRLLSEINQFFNKKTAIFLDEYLAFNLENGNVIGLSELSSGERQLVYIILKAVILSGDNKKSTVLIMDEPEISLHLEWQDKLLTCLYNINPNTQIVIATHSPAMIMNGWMASYQDMDNLILRSSNDE